MKILQSLLHGMGEPEVIEFILPMELKSDSKRRSASVLQPAGNDSWMSFPSVLQLCPAKLFRLGPKHRIWSLGDKSAYRSTQQISSDILLSLCVQNASKKAATMALNLVDPIPETLSYGDPWTAEGSP